MNSKAIRAGFAALALVLMQSPAFAQEDPSDNYAQMWRFDIKPGMYNDFMQAFSQHIAWRRENGETWTWMTYMPLAGERMYSVWVRSDGHTLADFDTYAEYGRKAEEHWFGTVDQYVGSYESWISQTVETLEFWPEDTQFELFQAFTYHVKPGFERQFDEAAKMVHDGLVKVSWNEPHSFDRLISGAGGYLMTLVLPYRNFADMAEPEKTFDEALAEAYGEKRAGELMMQIAESYGEVEEVLVRVDREHSITLDN
ncbi:MAG: hypothetical protein ACREVN_04215 [Gammaproteobacteria bacterium]